MSSPSYHGVVVRRGIKHRLGDVVKQSRSHVEVLDNLEDTITHLRRGIADENGEEEKSKQQGISDGTRKPPTKAISLERTTEEELEAELGLMPWKKQLLRCPKCEEEFLPALLDHHVKHCEGDQQGVAETHRTRSSEQDGEEENEGKDIEWNKEDIDACPLCNKNFLRSRLLRHLRECRHRAAVQQRKRQFQQETAEEFIEAPQGPQNLSVGGVTSSTVTLTWSTPLYNGGKATTHVPNARVESVPFFRKRNCGL